jgi:hypothetical protein
MRFATRLTVMVLFLALACATASAALQVSLPDGAGGRSWQVIAIEFPALTGDADVGVQDARGGPEIIRRVPGNTGRTWLPLPLVAPSNLSASPAGTWSLVVTLRSSDRLIEQQRVELALGRGGSEAQGLRLAASAPVPGFAGVCVVFPDQEILSAPPLVFAGFDLVLLSPDVQSRITRERALQLLAAGVRLAAPVDGASGPPGSARGGGAEGLGRFLWDQSVLGGGRALWITSGLPVPPPAVIEPGLGRLPETAGRQRLPRGIANALLLTGPLTMLLLVLKRGLFHRRRAVLAASTLSVAALTCGMILYLHAHALRQETLAHWRQAAASPGQPAAGILLEERLERCTAWFRATADVNAEAPGWLFPVAATVDQYWSLRGMQLRLDDRPRLTGTLPARSTLWWESRTADLLGVLPAFPTTAAERTRLWEALPVSPADAWWLLGGYVKPAANPDVPGTLFSSWVNSNPWAAGSPAGVSQGLPWYEMRFQPGHRYLLWRRENTLHVLDFGPLANNSTTPTP